MGNSPETGHTQNVANFEELITIVKGYGDSYKPTRNAISIIELNKVLAESNSSINKVSSEHSAYTIAVAVRESEFNKLGNIITRSLNALKASDSSAKVDESAANIVRKIQGKRATPKKSEEEIQALSAEGIHVKEVSASQMGYDNRLANFYKYVQLLSNIPEYQPNEEDLTVKSLFELHDNLKEKNKAVANTAIPLSSARIARNEILYKDNTGLVDISFDVKTYIKSAFGASSPQYKQVSSLKFSKTR